VRPDTNTLARLAQKAVYILIALAILRFWIMPLGSSLWRDEAGTFWTIKDGLRFIGVRSRLWPNTTPASGLVFWAAYAVGGAHEYALRLPSVMGIALASWFMYLLVKRLIDEDSALPAVAVFIGLQPVVFAATDARAYALILALAMGSTLALVNWLETGSRGYAATYIVAAALIPEIHYLALPILGVHAVYAVARLREGSPVTWRQLVLAGAAVGILIAPIAPAVLQMARQAQSHAFLRHPLLTDMADILAPSVPVFGAALGVLLAWMVCRNLQVVPAPVRGSTRWLLLALTAGTVFFFFAVSNIVRTSVFVERYMIASTAGLAMLAGWGIGRIRPAAARSIVTGSIVVCSLVSFGNVGRLWPLHGREDWRGAVQAIRRASGSTPIPVLAQSPFIESAGRSGNVPDYLLAPLLVYPPPGRVIPLSLSLDAGSRSYLETSALPALAHEDRFALLTFGDDNPYDLWMTDRLPGYAGRSLGRFGSVNATLFERSVPVR
jgi:Dolichyl-phosphate-mannose-protein mannosyltransferase